MSGSVNKVIALYISGKSIPEVSAITGVPKSTIRFQLKKAGALRTRADGVRIAAKAGKLCHLKGRARPPFSAEWRKNISKAKLKWAETHALGFSKKPSGYIEITRGNNKGKTQHVIIMQDRIGRNLMPDEVVHHIDGNRANNAADNLALMTRSGHSRHHRMIERMKKCQDR
jgi:hypothetical protein